jgi:hypothetical protein
METNMFEGIKNLFKKKEEPKEVKLVERRVAQKQPVHVAMKTDSSWNRRTSDRVSNTTDDSLNIIQHRAWIDNVIEPESPKFNHTQPTYKPSNYDSYNTCDNSSSSDSSSSSSSSSDGGGCGGGD